MDWFKDWFNTPYYHTLYKNRDYKEAEIFITNLISFLKPKPLANFMDLACGKGRFSIYLNSLNYKVTGLDLSQQSIKEASNYSTDNLKFFVHDMREVFKSNEFDYALNLFTSFGYFEDEKDNLKVFKSVYEQLKINGTFILDYLNTEKAVKELVSKEIKTIDGINFNISKQVKNQFIHKNIKFNADDNNWSFDEYVKIINLASFKSLASEANFKVIHTFGDYHLNDFDAEKSDRLILVLKKC